MTSSTDTSPVLSARRRSALVAGAAVIALPLSWTGAEAFDGRPATQASIEVAPGDPVVMAAGDIACPTTHRSYNGGEGTATQCRQKHTSELILGADAVLVLGDAQYTNGSLSQFQAVYDPTWGRMKAVTFPAPGDHEYASGTATGYFTYFGKPPYYSFDIGTWHFVSLNSEIDHAAGSLQEQWLRDDLASTGQPCIGAFWGTPRFSSGRHGSDASFVPFWNDLYQAKADVVLGGDDHDYERFAKQAPDGTAAADGIRQFVVGTGGRSLYAFETIQPNSQARAKVFGVLELTLGATDYAWRFVTESGGTFSDSGTETCNPKPGATATPSPLPSSPAPSPPPPSEPVPSPSPTGPSASCLGTTATIVGTAGDDTLTGTITRDVIAGLGGNDTIDGVEGNDLICGLAGADQLVGGQGDDQVIGGGGQDALTDLDGADVLNGNSGNDTLNASDAATGDTVNGAGDIDRCSGDAGDQITNCETVAGP